MLLEVIATTVEEAKLAEAAGANRIELIAAMEEGGLTPSLALVEETSRSVSIPVRVMVRPHSRSFVMSGSEIQTMIRDIGDIARTEAEGVVFGVLKSNATVDDDALRHLLDATGDLKVTFHRAFDEVRDQEEALETLSRYSRIATILTSGGRSSVLDAGKRIQKLVQLAADTHLTLLAGSGLTVGALEQFIMSTGICEVHMGSGVRASGLTGSPLDPLRIRQAREILDRIENGESGRHV